MQIEDFKNFYKLQNGLSTVDEYVNTTALTKAELLNIRKTIQILEDKGLPSSKIIEALQKMNKKLIQKWRAERAYYTEVKLRDTKIVGKIGEELDIQKYRVVMSPNPCAICKKKSNNGKKLFSNAEIDKSGYGHVPAFHPNCYCILLPV